MPMNEAEESKLADGLTISLVREGSGVLTTSVSTESSADEEEHNE